MTVRIWMSHWQQTFLRVDWVFARLFNFPPLVMGTNYYQNCFQNLFLHKMTKQRPKARQVPKSATLTVTSTWWVSVLEFVSVDVAVKRRSWTLHLFDDRAYSRRKIDVLKLFFLNFNVGFFSDTMKARSFKLCMVITLLGFYVVILGLMTSDLVSRSQMCQKPKLQIACFEFLSSVV